VTALEYLESLIAGQEMSTLPIHTSELKLLQVLLLAEINKRKETK